MSQGPSPTTNMSSMPMNASLYFAMGGMDGLPRNISASQLPSSGNDTSMGGMLDDSILDDFDNMPLNMDANSGLESNGGQAGFTPLTSMPPSENGHAMSSTPTDTTLTGAGAGPLPTGFGAPSTLGGGSTLTEFTKRRNWSQKVVEELQDFLHILTPDGRIVYLSPSSEGLTGYARDDLVGKFIVDYIHADDSGIFVREFNESIASGHPLRFFYRFRKQDGTYTIFESHGHPHLTAEASKFGPSNAAGFCRGFFMMARPYPTKNAGLLDSFLEHKMENERLTKKIEDLKREEEADADESERSFRQGREGYSEATGDSEGSRSTSIQPRARDPDLLAMPPPGKPVLNPLLTRQNLEDANASSGLDSMGDKMARYEGATHIETIEMLTGLRYQDGERSKGISTGDMSPSLIRGDAGIAIPIDKDARADKKKKIKLPDEYVCTDCGTLDSPEWRKGPTGPKTLCNACGLRWAKKEKKQKTGPSNAPTPMNPNTPMNMGPPPPQ